MTGSGSDEHEILVLKEANQLHGNPTTTANRNLLLLFAISHAVHANHARTTSRLATTQHVRCVDLKLKAIGRPGNGRPGGLAVVSGEHAEIAEAAEQELALLGVHGYERSTELFDVVGEERLNGRVDNVDDRVAVVARNANEFFVNLHLKAH